MTPRCSMLHSESGIIMEGRIMARPKKEKELNHYHFVSVRLSDIELENVDSVC